MYRLVWVVGSALFFYTFRGGFNSSLTRRSPFRRPARQPLHRNRTLIPRQPGGRHPGRGVAYGKLRLDSQPGASGQSHPSPTVALAAILPSWPLLVYSPCRCCEVAELKKSKSPPPETAASFPYILDPRLCPVSDTLQPPRGTIGEAQ